MRRTWPMLGFACALIIAPRPAPTPAAQDQPQAPTIDSHAVDTAVWDEMERQQIVGVAVAIIKNRKIVHVRGYGFADREACTPVTSQTLFRWASLSKPVTAIAAMQLWELGKLDLDTDVRTLVPEFPDKGKPITPRQLLSHQSGIPHGLDPTRALWLEWSKDLENDPAHDPIRALAVFADKPLVYPPGQQFHYSTPGFILLSALIQRAGDAPFENQVRDRITTPLGLASLQPERAWKRPPNRAAGYRRVRDSIVRVRALDVSWKLGGGGFCSNIQDAARFAEAILNFRLVKKSTYDQMWTPLKDSHGKDTRYGLGFQVERDPRGRKRVWHEGAQPKTRTLMVLYPESGTGIVILSNCEFANTGEFANAVEKALGH